MVIKNFLEIKQTHKAEYIELEKSDLLFYPQRQYKGYTWVLLTHSMVDEMAS